MKSVSPSPPARTTLDRSPIDAARLPELMTIDDVARLLQLTPKGVRSMVHARRIPHVKVSNRVRFFRDDVVAWLRDNRVPPSEVR